MTTLASSGLFCSGCGACLDEAERGRGACLACRPPRTYSAREKARRRALRRERCRRRDAARTVAARARRQEEAWNG